jgi:hypothetical protein
MKPCSGNPVTNAKLHITTIASRSLSYIERIRVVSPRVDSPQKVSRFAPLNRYYMIIDVVFFANFLVIVYLLSPVYTNHDASFASKSPFKFLEFKFFVLDFPLYPPSLHNTCHCELLLFTFTNWCCLLIGQSPSKLKKNRMHFYLIEIHPIVAFEVTYEPILTCFWSLISKLVCIHQNFLHRVYTNLNF